jgi:hypothetical protein
MLVDDHAAMRSAGAQSMLEGVACYRPAYVAGRWASGSPSGRCESDQEGGSMSLSVRSISPLLGWGATLFSSRQSA